MTNEKQAEQPKHTPGSCRHCGKEDIGLGHACEGMMGDPFREGRAVGNEQKLAADNAALRQQVATLRTAVVALLDVMPAEAPETVSVRSLTVQAARAALAKTVQP